MEYGGLKKKNRKFPNCEFLEIFSKVVNLTGSIQDRDYFFLEKNPITLKTFSRRRVSSNYVTSFQAWCKPQKFAPVLFLWRIVEGFTENSPSCENLLLRMDSRLMREIKREDDWLHRWQRSQICWRENFNSNRWYVETYGFMFRVNSPRNSNFTNVVLFSFHPNK